MRIQKVILENFRQFQGKNTIDFGIDSNSPVSLVYGTTGGGKTTVLSAMYWALHGTAPYITDNEKLLNVNLFGSLGPNDEGELSVAIYLEEGNDTFIVKRNRWVSKQGNSEVEVRPDQLSFTDLNGAPAGNPHFEVNRRFPQKFSKFFFVPGESIDDFFKSNSLASLIENIKEISDIGSYETAITIAEKVEKKLLKEISDFSSDSAVKTARDAIEALDAQINNLQQTAQRLELAEREEKARISELQRGLGDTSEFDQIAERLERIEANLKNLEIQEREVNTSLNRNLKARGFLAFTENLELDLADALNTLGITDSFENVISREVILEIAGRDVCICGAQVTEHSKKHLDAALQSMAGLGETRSEALRFTKLPADFGFDLFRSSINSDLERSNRLKQEILTLKASLERELSAEGNFDSRSNQYKELKAADFKLKATTTAKNDNEIRLKHVRDNRRTAEEKLAVLIEKDARQAKLGLDRDSVAKIKGHLELALVNYRDTFMVELENELNILVGALIFDPVKVKLGEDFGFELIRIDNGQKYSASSGQIKAKAMAMIIALYRIASRRARKGLSLENDSLVSFPLLIDSAFGELGIELRRRVAQELAKEVNQCIFFVSETQAPGVADSLDANRVSSRTLLHSFVTGSGSNVTEPDIDGKKVEWLTFNAKYSRTEVEDIK